MKYNPYFKEEHSLHVDCQINGSDSIDFCLDTSSPYTILSRETAEMLMMQGFIDEKETDICYGEVINIPVGRNCYQGCIHIDIEELALGNILLVYPNVFVFQCYGFDNILSMSAFEEDGEFTITNDSLVLEDGCKANLRLFDGHIPEESYEATCMSYLNNIRKYVEECGEEPPVNNIKPIIGDLTKFIDGCKVLLYQQEYEKVVDFICELESYICIHEDYCYVFYSNYGYYISGYCHLLIAEAYLGLDKMTKALASARKALLFFYGGSFISSRITSICKDAVAALETPEYKKIEPPIIKDFKEEVQEKELKQVVVVDNMHAEGKRINAYIGFENYDDAYDFANKHRKRLEVIHKEGDEDWQRTYLLGSTNLDSRFLLLGKFHTATIPREIDEYADRIIKKLETTNPEKIPQIRERQAELKNTLNSRESVCIELLFNGETLEWDQECLLKGDGHIKWHNQEAALAIFDVEESVALKYLPDVLDGCRMPCAAGTMPEDYYLISSLFTDKLSKCNIVDNGSGRLSLAPFVVYNNYGLPCWATRASYDNGKTWRWENLTYRSQENFYPRPYDEPDINRDRSIVYWCIDIADYELDGLRCCFPFI